MTITKIKTVNVPPDGGWGWVICVAYALSNVEKTIIIDLALRLYPEVKPRDIRRWSILVFSTVIIVIPILQSFGLIFNSKFNALGFTATEKAIIINTNASFGMLMGLINGSLLKQFGYRKMAIFAGLCVAGGVIITAFANSFVAFLISYGFITSFGFGLSMAAYSLALNSYFRKKRGIATGFAVTGTGLGPIIMPLWISFLLKEFGTSGCVLIIGGTALNTVAAGLLLQPLKWHMKKEIPDQELQLLDENKNDDNPDEKENRANMFSSTLSIDHDVETKSIYGFDTPLPRRKTSVSSYDAGKGRKRTFSRSVSYQPEKQSSLSINTINSLGSITEEKNVLPEEPKKKSLCSRIAEIFDLDLLKDPIFLNLLFGLSLAVYAEINFSLLTPFILNDYNFETFEIASIMSTIATADVLFRFCSPFIGDWLNFSPKLMYTISLLMLIASRTGLIFASSYTEVLVVAVALGIAKGFRTVFMSLLIPCYVPIEKLASASGMQMVVNGVISMIGGPILGIIRDYTGSYDKCIMVMNGMTFLTILMWTVEYLYFKFCKTRNI